MCRRIAVLVCAVSALGWGSAHAQASSSGADPSRRLAQSLAAQVRGAVDLRRELVPLLVVGPVADPTGGVGGGAKRVHTALVLELAKLPSMRISTVDSRAAPDEAWVLSPTLDLTREAVVLTAKLRSHGDTRNETLSFLAAVPATPAVLASLARSSGTQGRVRVNFSPAGDTDGPALAATSGPLRGDAGDELAVVSELSTHVLSFEGAAFHEAAAVTHPRSDGISGAAPARDPRAGVVALPHGGEPTDLWVRPPRGPAYVWRAEGGAVTALRRADEVPLAAWPGGGALLGVLLRGTNAFDRLAVAAGPQEPARDLDEHGGPFLEAAIGDGWLVLEDVAGQVTVEATARAGDRVGVGRFGSALGVLDGHPDDGIWVVGDRDDGATLVVSRVAGGETDELWHGPAPFRVCVLAPGHFTGKDRRELVAVGCESRAVLSLMTIEVEP